MCTFPHLHTRGRRVKHSCDHTGKKTTKSDIEKMKKVQQTLEEKEREEKSKNEEQSGEDIVEDSKEGEKPIDVDGDPGPEGSLTERQKKKKEYDNKNNAQRRETDYRKENNALMDDLAGLLHVCV